MAFLILLCSFMAIGPYAIIATPVSPVKNTFFDAIGSYCSNGSELLTKQKEIFANCQNFEKINKSITLTDDNVQNVLCLLYYNRIISYCQSKPKQFEYPTLDEVIGKKYKIEDICKNMSEYSKASIKENACLHLCTDLADNDINPGCLWSHFYNSLLKNVIVSSTTPASKTTKPTPLVNPVTLTGVDSKPAGSPKVQTNVAGTVPGNGGDSEPIGNSAPDTVLNVEGQSVAGGSTSNDAPVPKTNVAAVPKPAAGEPKPAAGEPKPAAGEPIPAAPEHKPVQDHKEDQVPVQSSDNNPPTNDHSSGTVQIQSAPTQDLKSPSHPEPVILQAGRTVDAPPQIQQVPVQVPAAQETPTVSKQPVPKVDDVQESRKAADEPKPNENPPKLENGDADIDDGEGQHGISDNDDYNGLAEGESLPDETVPQPVQEAKQKVSEKKPDTLEGSPVNTDNIDEIDGESYFMSYFMVVCLLVVLGYVGYHNRIKVMALLLEGKRNRRPYRGRRPNSANYHKLDSNLEEAISSNVTKNSNNVIY